ncbi:MAG: hydrogenase small subunit [Proteobacteria bacterium]|nr:hydrogenase small subunit [Pseudomonadota bacterium]
MSNESKKEIRNSVLTRLSEAIQQSEPQHEETLGERLAKAGVTRRSFMKYCAGMASIMAIPASMVPKLAEAALLAPVTSVVYLSFQECTGCLESLVNVFPNTQYKTNSIENILLTALSLDYSETLMAPSGTQAELSRAQAIAKKNYVLVVDGAIPDDKAGAGFFIQSGKTGLQQLKAAATNAAAVVSVGTCASFGGLPAAKGPADLINPGNLRGVSPTRAISIKAALKSFGGTYATKPVINVSGCPPIAEVIAGTLVYWILNKKAPSLDSNLRPKMFYGETVHDECYRKEFLEHGQFVRSFDDAGARAGHCLLMMGCKGPTTHNACTTLKWNQGIGFPMEAGHGCLGCSEPDFWDKKSIDAQGIVGVGFYNHLDPATVDD